MVGHHPADLDTSDRTHPRELFATAEEMATVLDPAEWTIEVGAPVRQATGRDGAVVTLRDAVLRAVRHG